MIIPSHYQHKYVAILGLGKSGKAAVDAFVTAGATVYLWDDKKDLCEELASTYPSGNVIFDEYLLSESSLATLDLVVPSPGVHFMHPEPHPFLAAARAAHVPIKSDLDILKETCPDATYIGITGTNGKSTTTALIGHIIKEAGKTVSTGGNLGTPMLALEPQGKDGFFVLELSSYQLEITQNVAIDIAALLNLTPDHLDRHVDMQGYSNAKKRIFSHAKHAIIVCEDDYTTAIAKSLAAPNNIHVIALTHTKAETSNIPNTETLTYTSGTIYHNAAHETETILKENFSYNGHELTFTFNHLKGLHNSQNIAVCFAISSLIGIKPHAFLEHVSTFSGLPHRCQYVMHHHQVMIINDSKATNADSTTKALESFDNIYLIAGGLPKTSDYSAFTPYLHKIKKAYLIGEGAQDLATYFAEHTIPCALSETLQNATEQSLHDAAEQDTPATLLLSPACASFDQFKSFEERGHTFIEIVHKLTC